MSHDEQVRIINLLEEVFGPRFDGVARVLSMARWAIVVLVLGTTTVVGFVLETRFTLRDARGQLDRNTVDIKDLKLSQHATDLLVNKHEYILNQPN